MRISLLALALFTATSTFAALPPDVLAIDSGTYNAGSNPFGRRIFKMTQNATYNGEFAGPNLSPFGVAESICEGPNGTILVTGQQVSSDSTTGSIFQFSEAGVYLGIWAAPLKNLRGISRRKDGTYLVANGTDNTVDIYSATGTYVGVFASTPSPWHAIELRNGEVLISRSTTFSGGNTPQVEKYSSSGIFVGNFATGYPFSRMMHECADGNIIITVFSLPGVTGKGNAAYEFTPAGVEVATYQLDGPRAVMELATGRILVGDGTEMRVFDRGGGNPETLNGYNKTTSTSVRMFFSKYHPVKVDGTVDLQGWTVSPAGQQVTLEFVLAGTGNLDSTVNVTLDANSQYSFTSTKRGLFDVYAKASHWLRRKVASVNLDQWGATISPSLLNGDVDGDNVVSVFDYIILSDAFDSTPSDAAWDARADLDGDEVISVFDYIQLSDNFDASGDDY